METILKALIEKLPVRALSLTIGFVLAWITGLTLVGLLTHRAVGFFPPQIGSDPVLQREVAGLSSQVKTLTETQMAYRSQIFSAQQHAMEELISIRRSISYGESEAKSNIERYSAMLTEQDVKLSASIEDLTRRVTELETKL